MGIQDIFPNVVVLQPIHKMEPGASRWDEIVPEVKFACVEITDWL